MQGQHENGAREEAGGGIKGHSSEQGQMAMYSESSMLLTMRLRNDNIYLADTLVVQMGSRRHAVFEAI